MLNFKAVGIVSCWGSAAGWQWQVTDGEEDDWYSIQQIYFWCSVSNTEQFHILGYVKCHHR